MIDSELTPINDDGVAHIADTIGECGRGRDADGGQIAYA